MKHGFASLLVRHPIQGGIRMRVFGSQKYSCVAFSASRSAMLIVLIMAVACNSTVADESAQQTAHLYFFTNHGCAPCRQVEPGIEALKREGYPVSTVFLNQQPQLGSRMGVTATPTVVLVSENRIVGRHAGLIDGVTLKQWFAAVGVEQGTAFAGSRGGTKVRLDEDPRSAGSGYSNGQASPRASRDAFAGSPTLHRGTRQPQNRLEQTALNSTVRLKVEDPQGISYATGTVIHQHQGECLVATCGHVFRDAQGKGVITAEFGFDGRVQSAPGKLISYDADARDIGLVAIRTDHAFEPVPIAAPMTRLTKGVPVFSIGCDHGDSPTIRHSQIKNRAAYDGSIKYDIFGRPVDGRSGGGLFNEQGELVGICNAAAVEEDEGIYTALETIHWQLANVNLDHLFTGQRLARQDAPSPRATAPRMQVAGSDQQTFAASNSELARIQRGPINQGSAAAQPSRSFNQVSWGVGGSGESDKEVIIIVRSRTNPGDTQAITVSHPSPELLQYLDSMQPASISEPRHLDVAQLRKRIPFEGLEIRSDTE